MRPRWAATLLAALGVWLLGEASSGVLARGLLAETRCTDLSFLVLDAPEVSTAAQLLKALQPSLGLPMGASLFLPTNDALASLPSTLDLPFTVDYILGATAALGPELANRLKSILDYLFVPVGALKPASLAAVGLLPTAFNGSALLMSQPVLGQFTVTDGRGVTARLLRTAPLPTALGSCLTAVYVVDKLLLPAAELGSVAASPNSAFSIEPPFQPLSGPTYVARSTYYGPDRAHGIHGGNDNIFEHIPSSQYTPWELFQAGRRYCAMTEQFLRMGYMGKVVAVTGPLATLNFVVVDLLPDRHDGQNVAIDVHNQEEWLALGGDTHVGMLTVSFRLVGRASVAVSPYSPWDPKKFGFSL